MQLETISQLLENVSRAAENETCFPSRNCCKEKKPQIKVKLHRLMFTLISHWRSRYYSLKNHCLHPCFLATLHPFRLGGHMQVALSFSAFCCMSASHFPFHSFSLSLSLNRNALLWFLVSRWSYSSLPPKLWQMT